MEQLTVQVVCFAGLRKYFGSKTEVKVEVGSNYHAILEALAKVNPEASEVLESCRIAVNEQFVSPDSPLKQVDTVFLIPPSSGG